MPISAAAMDGIDRFGYKMVFKGPRIRQYAKAIGEFKDLNGTFTNEDVLRFLNNVKSLVSTVERWIEAFPRAKDGVTNEIYEEYDLRHRESMDNISEFSADDINEDHDGYLDEVIATLDDLYDTFDYYRIRVR